MDQKLELIEALLEKDLDNGVNIAENEVAAPSYGKLGEPDTKTNMQTCISIANNFHCS